MYCWLKPEISASCSCVRPFFCLIRLTFPPTSLRMSICADQRITHLKFINYNMYNLEISGGVQHHKSKQVLPVQVRSDESEFHHESFEAFSAQGAGRKLALAAAK